MQCEILEVCSRGQTRSLSSAAEEFWPVVGYDLADTASDLVLTLLDGCQIKLTKAEFRHFRGFELRTVVQVCFLHITVFILRKSIVQTNHLSTQPVHG